MRFGAKVPNSGPDVDRIGLVEPARRAESAGFSSVWLSDHIVQPMSTRSRYPYADDGAMTWDPRDPWYDAIVVAGVLAATTATVEIGVAVLLPTLRNPVELAKQLATVDAVSAGRLVLGVGAGWMAEEFEALGVPFQDRGARLDEWIGLLRSCWTGEPPAHDGRHYRLPAGVLCYPRPHRPVPVLVGGMTPAALRRAGRLGDGWVPLPRPSQDVVATVRDGLAAIQTARDQAGPAVGKLRCVLNAHDPTSAAALLPELDAVGVTDVLVDVDFDLPDGPEQAMAILRDADRPPQHRR